MKNYLFEWIIKAAIVMLIIPYIVLNLIPADASMAVCLILLFVVNTFFAAYTGWISGKNIHLLWTLPFAMDVLFAVGYSVIIEMDFSAIMYYVILYTITAFAGMFFSSRVNQ